MGLLGTIICSASQSYVTLRAGRIVQGFSFSAYESLIFSTVADLFFVHQRGVFISFFGFALAAVSNLTSVVCGPITNTLGWVSRLMSINGRTERLTSSQHYLFHILDALLGFQLLLVFFFVPETAYERDVGLEIDQNVDDSAMEKPAQVKIERVDDVTGNDRSASTSTPPKKTFFQSLAIFTGTHSDENLLPLILAPILVNGESFIAVWTESLPTTY